MVNYILQMNNKIGVEFLLAGQKFINDILDIVGNNVSDDEINDILYNLENNVKDCDDDKSNKSKGVADENSGIYLSAITDFIKKCSNMGIYYKLDLTNNICFLERFDRKLYESACKTH